MGCAGFYKLPQARRASFTSISQKGPGAQIDGIEQLNVSLRRRPGCHRPPFLIQLSEPHINPLTDKCAPGDSKAQNRTNIKQKVGKSEKASATLVFAPNLASYCSGDPKSSENAELLRGERQSVKGDDGMV